MSPTSRAIRSALGIALAIAMVLVTGACAGRSGGSSKTPLRVGVAPYYPPIIFEANGQISGLEADFAASVGAELGRRVEFVEMTRQELVPAVEAGRVDIAMSGISVTPDRVRRVLFTTPYLHIGQLSLIRTEDLGMLSRASAIRRPGVRIGYVDATTGEQFVTENLSNAETYAFGTVEEGVRNLRARRIDIFIHDAPTVWRIGMDTDQRDLTGLFKPLTDEALAWAVSRKDPELKARLDEILDVWKASGQLDRFLNRWIPVRVTVGR